ncbi:MAG: alpha/beta hydrolase [Ilumatobacteraceae bacterium]
MTTSGGIRLYVDVDGVQLEPTDDGLQERPTVVMLHGGPGIDHVATKCAAIRRLNEVAQVLYYDHRGHGRSDRGSPAEWNLDTWADDVVGLCDALEISRPIVLGNSFGGFVAQRYLARHPDHPGKVVLCATAPRLDVAAIHDAFVGLAGAEAGDIARRVFEGDQGALAAFFEQCLPYYSVHGIDGATPRAFGVPDGEMLAHFESGEHQTMDLAPGLAAARCPVLVLSGELDPIMPARLIDEMVAALPAHLTTDVRLPGTSHMDVTGPEGTARIREFILGS